MTKAYMNLLAQQFYEDTGCYAPGYMPEPETRVPNEENHHRQIWLVWSKGRTRGLSVHVEGTDEIEKLYWDTREKLARARHYLGKMSTNTELRTLTEEETMTKTQKVGHTPGPWEFKDEGAGGWGVYAKGDKDWPEKIFGSCDCGYPSDEDGRLIAACPELLAALKDARRIWGRDGSRLAEEIDAAIAKAEGR